MSRHREERLANGLILLVEELPRPAVAAQLVIPGGSANDPAGREGTATLLARLMQRGAGERTTRQLAEAFDELGYRHGVSASQANAMISITGLAEAWDQAFALLADVVRRPRLPESEFEACRQLAVQALRGLDDEPAQKLQVEIVRRYFPGPVSYTHLSPTTMARIQSLPGCPHPRGQRRRPVPEPAAPSFRSLTQPPLPC